MTRGLANEEREFFDQHGFLVFDRVFTDSEVEILLAAVDEVYERYRSKERRQQGRHLEIRNVVTHHPAFLALLEHRALLPRVVELLGPNICLRSSHLDFRPPLAANEAQEIVGRDREAEPLNWHVDGPLAGFATVGELLPLMEVKIGYYLTDVSQEGSGHLAVVPGSHKLDYRRLGDRSFRIPDEQVFPVKIPPGGAILFRTGLWHCATPNRSSRTRKVLYYAYTHRWVRPSDYIEQPASLLEGAGPVTRQLLSAPAKAGLHPLGDEPEATPCAFFWYTDPADLPLFELYESLQRSKPRG